jgi:hypothetical protein
MESIHRVAATAAASLLLAGPVAAATEMAQVADASAIGLTVGATGAIAGLAYLLVTTDPGKRRSEMAEAAGGNEMESVKNYFDTAGFERWNKIYGTTSVRRRHERASPHARCSDTCTRTRWCTLRRVRGVHSAGCRRLGCRD